MADGQQPVSYPAAAPVSDRPRPTTVLLVDTNSEGLSAFAAALASVADRVCVATDFKRARAMLLDERPDILVTQVRLGEFNGLHLALWGRMHIPRLRPVIIGCSDPILETLARVADLFFIRHDDEQAVVQATLEAIQRQHPRRRWSRTAVARLPARVNGEPVGVVDLGYGGFCVEMAAPPAAGARMLLALETSSIGMQIHAISRWTVPVEAGRYRCGADLEDAGTGAGSLWRVFVNGWSCAPKSWS